MAIQIKKEEAKKVLLALMQDPDLRKLSSKSEGVNIFDVLKVSRMEIRHSNVLGWLLDPNGSHEMGDAFLYRFISKLSESLSVDTSLKLLSSDLYSFSVRREWKNIDILLVSEKAKTVVVIENKIGAQEHDANNTNTSQLDTYQKTIQTTFLNRFDSVFIYLTPEGDIPSNDDWIIATYYDVLELLEDLYYEKRPTLKPEVNVLIDNYIKNLKDNVIMDQELVNLCNDIYNKHRVALDLIYENRDDIAARISSLIRTNYKDSKDIQLENPKTSRLTKSVIKFLTPNLMKCFDGLKPMLNFFYQFQVRPKDDYLILELVFHQPREENLDDKFIEKIKTILPKSQELKKDWQWKRAWSIKVEDISLKSDEELTQSIKECVNVMLRFEQEKYDR